ncbi:hypothetical protein IJ098_03720 [Candidatus Saccharibacteria bacterium]|nr:hypothetical protein [Candidatus Saccharibacteria bacterium]
MDKIKTRVRQFLYHLKHDVFIFDNIIIIVAIAAGLYFTWGSISSMSRNWELASTLAEKQRELALVQLEVETMKLQNAYYQSNEYQELAARHLQNKILPGETMVYLPDNSTAAKQKHSNEVLTTEDALRTPEMSNFDQWMGFLFGA